MTVTAGDVDAAIACVMSGLLPLTDRDWSVRAGTLEWDCRHTAEHIGDCLLSYAWQLPVQPTTRSVRAVATAEKDASPAEVLEFAVTGGRVLASMVRTSPAHVRAFHPAGNADPEGFAALGCNEALLHGNDIAQGFGLSLDPSRDVCRRVLARLYPQAPAERAPPASPRPRSPTPIRGRPCSGPERAPSSPATRPQPGARAPPPSPADS